MKTVLTEQIDRVLVVTLQNPPDAVFTEDMVKELANVVTRVNADPSIGAVVLTGNHPDRLVGGFDVETLVAEGDAAPSLSVGTARRLLGFIAWAQKFPRLERLLSRTPLGGLFLSARFSGLFAKIQNSDVVWVGALNGSVMGLGNEIALACDVRFMADGPFMVGQPEVLLGILPGVGGTQRLTHLLGPRRALAIVLDGGGLTPDQALEAGLIDRVLPADALRDAAIAEAQRLAKRPKATVGALKRSVYNGATLSMTLGLREETAEFLALMSNPETRAALRGFVDENKRAGDLPAYLRSSVEAARSNGRFS